MATHSSVPVWRISGMGEPGGLPSMGLHRVGHYWSDLAAAAAAGYNDEGPFLFLLCLYLFSLYTSFPSTLMTWITILSLRYSSKFFHKQCHGYAFSERWFRWNQKKELKFHFLVLLVLRSPFKEECAIPKHARIWCGDPDMLRFLSSYFPTPCLPKAHGLWIRLHF